MPIAPMSALNTYFNRFHSTRLPLYTPCGLPTSLVNQATTPLPPLGEAGPANLAANIAAMDNSRVLKWLSAT